MLAVCNLFDSIEQARRVVHHGAFDREHFQLGHHSAMAGEATGLAAGGEHAMAGDQDRHGIVAECLTDLARALDTAELSGDVAIGQRPARRNAPRDRVDAAVAWRWLRSTRIPLARHDQAGW